MKGVIEKNMNIKEHTLKTLAVILEQPDKYHDLLELPVHVAKVSDTYFMSYMGIIVQGILVINQAGAELNKANYRAYFETCKELMNKRIAYHRIASASVRDAIKNYMELNVPIDWIKPFMKEYQLKLYGNFMYVDYDTKEYLTDFNDTRLIERARELWTMNYQPLLKYEHRTQILDILGVDADE